MINTAAKLFFSHTSSSWRASAISGPLQSQPVPFTQPLVLGGHLQTLTITPPSLQLPPLATGAEGKPWEEIFLTSATPADKLTTERASKLSKAVIPLPYSGETASFSLKKINPSHLLLPQDTFPNTKIIQLEVPQNPSQYPKTSPIKTQVKQYRNEKQEENAKKQEANP